MKMKQKSSKKWFGEVEERVGWDWARRNPRSRPKLCFARLSEVCRFEICNYGLVLWIRHASSCHTARAADSSATRIPPGQLHGPKTLHFRRFQLMRLAGSSQLGHSASNGIIGVEFYEILIFARKSQNQHLGASNSGRGCAVYPWGYRLRTLERNSGMRVNFGGSGLTWFRCYTLLTCFRCFRCLR